MAIGNLATIGVEAVWNMAVAAPEQVCSIGVNHHTALQTLTSF